MYSAKYQLLYVNLQDALQINLQDFYKENVGKENASQEQVKKM